MHVRVAPVPIGLLVLALMGCGGNREADPAASARQPVGESTAVAAGGGEALDPGPAVHPEPDAISTFVRRIFQDGRGHLWFGTNGDGVCRYDGESLECFSLDDGFGGVAVRAILGDPEGRVWFGTEGGVTRYDGAGFVNFTEADGLPSNDVWSMCVDRDGTLWVGTFGGACRFDPGTGRFTSFPLPPAPSLDPLRGVTSLTLVHAIMEDREGNLWFTVGNGGAHRYDGVSITSITPEDGLPNGSVNDILEDRRGDLWFATHHAGICRFDGRTFTSVNEADGVQGTEAWSLFEDRAGNVWFPTEGYGVYRYDGKTFRNFARAEGLESGAIQCVHEDREGRIWAGGYLGLYRLEGERFIRVSRDGPW